MEVNVSRPKIECSSEQQAVCPLKRHVYNFHHIYWPAFDYHSPLEKAFRNLAENVVLTCTYEHNLYHALNPPPDKPPRDVMIQAVNRPDL